jgi:hypothetical protein
VKLSNKLQFVENFGRQAKACRTTQIEAGSRSPLHNPASTHGRLATTELNLVLSILAMNFFEAGSRSPLHNPASTLGHLATTESMIALSNLASIRPRQRREEWQ